RTSPAVWEHREHRRASSARVPRAVPTAGPPGGETADRRACSPSARRACRGVPPAVPRGASRRRHEILSACVHALPRAADRSLTSSKKSQVVNILVGGRCTGNAGDARQPGRKLKLIPEFDPDFPGPILRFLTEYYRRRGADDY